VIDRTPPEHAGLRGPGGQARGVLAVVGGRQDDQLGPGAGRLRRAVVIGTACPAKVCPVDLAVKLLVSAGRAGLA
jgi:hypothetical protein